MTIKVKIYCNGDDSATWLRTIAKLFDGIPSKKPKTLYVYLGEDEDPEKRDC